MFKKSVRQKVISTVFYGIKVVIILVNCLDYGLAINPDRFVNIVVKDSKQASVMSAVQYFTIMENKIVR